MFSNGDIIAGNRNRSKSNENSVRINDQINVPEVRLIGADGEQVGVISTKEAMRMASDEDLDLVEVASGSNPPVCRLMDYGKYKYQQSKRQHEAKKHQKIVQLKEVKMRPRTEDHDFQFKLKNALRFINDGNKVKVVVEFRGRELAHKDLGLALLEKFKTEVGELAQTEQEAKSEGRSLSIILAPNRGKK